MKERPILFSAPMVRALLDGSKTQTRRVCKPAAALSAVVAVQDPNERGQRPPYFTPGWFGDEDGEVQFYCPYGQPGDQLWVRETWANVGTMDPGLVVYRADYPACVPPQYQNVPPAADITWKPSIHMFRAASRITLDVTGVRIERLQDISEADARAEGVALDTMSPPGPLWRRELGVGNWHSHAKGAYRELWEQINGPGSWDANPWVWVIEFKRLTP